MLVGVCLLFLVIGVDSDCLGCTDWVSRWAPPESGTDCCIPRSAINVVVVAVVVDVVVAVGFCVVVLYLNEAQTH